VAGTITALKAQKRNKNRVNVYLDGHYSFSLVSHLAVPLRRGQGLSDEEIARLKEQDEYHQAYERVSKLIAHRPRSEAEVRQYMARQGVAPTLTEQVIERLTTVGLLDDGEFARLWVENRETFRPRSRQMLRYEMRQKGLDEDTIGRVLEQVDEEESARRLARQQGRRLAHLDWPTFRQKLTGYLGRRGYPYEFVRRAVREAWQTLSENDSNTPTNDQESEEDRWMC
jgi:regulatory protein